MRRFGLLPAALVVSAAATVLSGVPAAAARAAADPIGIGSVSVRGSKCTRADLRVSVSDGNLVVGSERFRAELGPIFSPPRPRDDATCAATIQLDPGAGRRVVLDGAAHTQNRYISPRSTLTSTAKVEFGGGAAPYETVVKDLAAPLDDEVVLEHRFPAPLTGACGRATVTLTERMLFTTEDATQLNGVHWSESRIGARTEPC
ncbi:hypothetical protein GCM10010124_35100 [Pilimelia terevasa]|uniref:Uncharacterized protein n=1 Tax=Pilimelia terevasa TaxID=53372 RepID=A0A8J3FL83_9ACTN|nr:DUF4360 domain-containing protein [Pilimelia terevasa]GGK39363.1 hypothetical protein GCM10010124_35100 [Pilimelia terevasa]